MTCLQTRSMCGSLQTVYGNTLCNVLPCHLVGKSACYHTVRLCPAGSISAGFHPSNNFRDKRLGFSLFAVTCVDVDRNRAVLLQFCILRLFQFHQQRIRHHQAFICFGVKLLAHGRELPFRCFQRIEVTSAVSFTQYADNRSQMRLREVLGVASYDYLERRTVSLVFLS